MVTALSTAGVLGVNATAIALVFLATWLCSLPLRNASIVDIVWGAGFVMVAWLTRVTADSVPARQDLLVVLTSVWGLRLAGYLLWRNAGHGEDRRYRAMRRRAGERFWYRSLLTVFALQAALMWVVSLPVQLGQTADAPGRLGTVTWVGVALWLVGFGFESIGDLQLARFKADPANDGHVLSTGLWRYTRHPNYFGDACAWWGLYLVAADTVPGRWSVVGPVTMTVLLMRVSGIPLLERSLRRRRPDYDDYMASTPAFFPRPRRH